LVETYIAKTLHGEIVAFARGADDVIIYCPDGRLRLQEKISLTDQKWQEQKNSYAGRSDIDRYNDTVNAAWHALASNTFNRDHVKLLKNDAGTYYPRIWRGIFDLRQAYCYNNVKPRIIYNNSYIGSNVATSSIFDAMEALFSYN
jgi:hypothetical protein